MILGVPENGKGAPQGKMENDDQPLDFSDTPVVSQERHKESPQPGRKCRK
jgi:hypothetical protein